MSEEQSKRREAEEIARVDHLLSLLGKLSANEPSPALRERLSMLAFQRLQATHGRAGRFSSTGRRPLMWLKPTLAVACLAAVLATGLVIHFYERGYIQNTGTAKAIRPAISPETRVHTVPGARPSVGKLRKVHHSLPPSVHLTSPRQMTIPLPYSNSAIETGTDTTIRVSMSQSELLSLGFPINTSVQDRRIVAELMLGDDGLPRAISLPLPLEVIKEKK